MKSGQGFLLVFSITSMSSLRELTELREQLIRVKEDPKVPLVLVGNKADLSESRVVSRSRAHAVSQSWGDKPFYETSARQRTNVDEVFIDLCRQIIRRDMELARSEDEGGRSRDPHRHARRRRRRHNNGPRCTILWQAYVGICKHIVSKVHCYTILLVELSRQWWDVHWYEPKSETLAKRRVIIFWSKDINQQV